MALSAAGAAARATTTAALPDKHYFRGSFGGRDVILLFRDPSGTLNVAAGARVKLEEILGQPVAGQDLFAYAYALLSSPAYTEMFWEELEVPGPRLPITRDPTLFT